MNAPNAVCVVSIVRKGRVFYRPENGTGVGSMSLETWERDYGENAIIQID